MTLLSLLSSRGSKRAIRFSRPHFSRVGAFSIAALVGACAAHDPSGSDENSDGETPTNVDASGKACAPASGPGVLRRLTAREYQTSLRELFGRDDVPFAEPLTGNVTPDAYSTNAAGLWVRDLDAQSIQNHAEDIGDWVVATDPALAASCTDHTDACGTQIVTSFGRRAYRMPLTAEQTARQVAVFLAGDDFAEGLSMVVSTMLQSPYFLYRRELGAGSGGKVPLTDHELGSALSYFLTGGPPDTELSSVIDSGLLRDDAEWQVQVNRLVESPEAEERLIEFVVEWLGLEDALTRTKNEEGVELTDSLRQSMMGEVEALVRHVLATGGSAAQLLSNDLVFPNAELAAHYSMTGPAGVEHEPVPAGDRTGGLLGTGAYLLSHSTVDSSSPTLRGVFVRKRLLCLEILAPPPTVDTNLPALTGEFTTRQRFEVHLESPACATCHESFDNFGYAFESYDGLGRYRTTQNGIAVDSSGETRGLDAGDQSFANAPELMSLLADDEQVERCFYQNLTEYVVGQTNWDNICSINHVKDTTNAGGGSLREALRSVLTLPHIEARVAQGAL